MTDFWLDLDLKNFGLLYWSWINSMIYWTWTRTILELPYWTWFNFIIYIRVGLEKRSENLIRFGFILYIGLKKHLD